MHEATRAPASAAKQRMLREVADGLRRPQKELPPKYFYDPRGSLLFDEITQLPEYYLTRIERELLESFAKPWLAQFRPNALVELGAGSGEKTRILLDAMPPGAWYVPVDISASYLEAVAAELGEEYPRIRIVPAEADISRNLAIPDGLPRPAVIAFLGSTIGNFDSPSALRLLAGVRRHLENADRFLMGVDLRKDRRTLEAAYNDSRGVTAAFNKNILRVLNRELGANFDLDAFDHHAFYDDAEGRIEMHLVARSPQVIRIPRLGQFTVQEGESIHTEISCKYDRPAVEAMLADSGLRLDRWIPCDSMYALVVARPKR